MHVIGLVFCFCKGMVRRARGEVRHGQRRRDRRLQRRLRLSFETHERGLLLLPHGQVSIHCARTAGTHEEKQCFVFCIERIVNCLARKGPKGPGKNEMEI